MNITARESSRSTTSGSEPASPTPDSVTHAATRWLAAMEESDASDGEIHAVVATPRVRKEPHFTSNGHGTYADAGGQHWNGQWQSRHKREFHENDIANVAQQTPTKRAKRKYRKSTIDIRKEEIAKMLKELAGLHSRMEQLNARAMKPCTADESTSEAAVANRVLRRVIQKQQLEVTQFHALMSEYALFSIRVGSPIHQAINLPRDEESRVSTLTMLKTHALELGAHFLKDRCPRINPCKSMREDHGYEAPNGDFYATYFSTSQFENSVKNVFDILLGYFSSIEICVSEKLGNITIREDDENLAPGITQNRLITTTIGSLQMESNTVYFSHYEEGGSEPGHEHGYGLFVTDFVDKDERSPYHPHERIRRDFSAVLELTSYPIHQHTSKTKTVGGSSCNGEEERVVVVTRWIHSRVHRPQYEIPHSGWHEMRENTERWIQTLHQTMLERNFTMT
ncbi:hypothetical protein JG687_00013691 [Phytophthora cactorum]|uniref:Uncharacterized protein n=1 Tax=Phytophthora cactorum TaxID=29920 RepID=A0A329RF74_9STRA|nr:hypothetical protein Pcac1_g20961 [Phytophthora cactorum]KAG3002384.1 hypothetical protein PC120_g19761 [Phytophthora cactorum]KAG3048398.1 hypothetical protein PC121_g19511 [Phytophthora cactorum]KAG3191993.1 hypothetical protein PC128_g10727 [Phytophthora cactorum]KAG3211311.1 hypothetical protein PC129_g17702 [Phytophthora cactorum]